MRIYKPNAEIEYDTYAAQKLHMIENEIRSLRDEYILNVNQEEYNILAMSTLKPKQEIALSHTNSILKTTLKVK